MSNQKDAPLTQPLARYAHVRQVGPVVFVAGQGCRDAKTDSYAGLTMAADGTVIAYDIGAQAEGVLKNVESALGSIGLDRQDIVDIQVFLTDMRDFPAMNKVWNAFFEGVPQPPTRTTVCVSKLPGHNFVEMKAVAAARPSAP